MNALAIIHIGKKQLGMSDDDYRALLKRVTGKTSSKGCSEKQHLAIIAEMERLGFKKSSHSKKPLSDKKWVRLIFALWKSCHKAGSIKDGSRGALVNFVKKETEKHGERVDDPNWLTYSQADPIIRALKAMEKRQARG